MDEIQRRKLRAVGAIAVLVIVILFIFFIFLQEREKKNNVIRLKMFYADMAQTLQFSMNSNGPPGDWGWHAGYRNANVINNYIVNYLRVSKNCVAANGDCLPKLNYRTLGKRPTKVNLSSLPSVKMNNGISFAVETVKSCKKQNSTCAIFYVDVNGEKKPNMFGRDLFAFELVNSTSIPFAPYKVNTDKNTLLTDSNYGCNHTSNIALYCCALIYSNSWSIGKKYPW